MKYTLSDVRLVSFIVDVKKHHRCVPKDNEFRCLANGRSDQGGCRAKWNNCIPQDIDTSCRYDNDPR